MKMRLIICCVMAISAMFLNAQTIVDREKKIGYYNLYLQGMEYQISQNYEQAYPCYEQALNGYHAIGYLKGEVEVLMKMGEIQNHWGNDKKEVVVLETAYVKAKQADLKNQMFEILAGLRSLYMSMNAVENYNKVGALMDSMVLQTDNIELKMNHYCTRGDECKQQKNYELAAYYYEKYIGLAEQLDSITQLRVYSNYYSKMRDLKATLKEYKEAILYGEKQVELFQLMYGQDDVDRYMPFMELSNIYADMGDSINADRCIDSLDIALGLLPEPREKAWIYTLKGMRYARIKNYGRALKEYEEADKALAVRYGEDDEQRISNVALRAGALYQLNRYEESSALFAKYAEILKVKKGEDSNDYAEALYYQANIEAFSMKIERGGKLYEKAVEIFSRNMKSQWQNLSLRDRETYWDSFASRMFGMTAFAQKGKLVNEAFTESCYNALLLSKALLLNSERSLANIVQTEGTEEDRNLYERLLALQMKMMELKRDFQQNKDSIMYIHDDIRKLDNQLADRFKAYNNYMSFLNVNYADIKKGLKDGDLLVDFADYFSDENVHQYVAYIIKKNQQYPLLVKMFTEEEIDSLINGQPMDVLYKRKNTETVMDLFWNRIKPYVKEGKTVYYVPSGIMYQIALESLPMDENVILGERYNFVRLSSAKELLGVKTKLKHVANATLYGGLQYDLDEQTMLTESQKYEIPSLYALRGELRGDSVFRKLPQTLEEVQGIEDILRDKGCRVTMHSEVNGTEESFVSMTGKAPDILHIATHGFYYTPDEIGKNRFLQGYTDAMALSGLIMAGGNAAWLGKELPNGVLDGVLTAQNVATLDLTRVELLVLSACQTGQGNVTAEGLFGLQRAFKKAGVKTMVMTLWQVSDKVTKEFMIEFYKNLVKMKWNKRKAFEKAKSIIRDIYPEPFYWSGFVMID